MCVTTSSPGSINTWLPTAYRLLYWIALFFWLAPALVTATDAIPPKKAVIKLTPKFGPVTFAHQRHSNLEGVRCITCHHSKRAKGEQIRSCYACHEAQYFSIANIRKARPDSVGDSGATVRNAQQAFHGLCTGCHKDRKDKKLPTGPSDSCRDCHR